jgi:hypothetical protein
MQRRAFASSCLAAICGLIAARPAFCQTQLDETILVIGPSLDLYLRPATGPAQIQPAWSQAARNNVSAALRDRFSNAMRECTLVDPSVLMEGRPGQIMRLYARIAEAALNAQQRRSRRKSGLIGAWSVGPGAQTLGHPYRASQAFIIEGEGAYASQARSALSSASSAHTFVGAAGGNIVAAATLGMRFVRGEANGALLRAGLLDLTTGGLIWIREITAEENDDLRVREGAERVLANLLEYSPL